MDQLSVEHTNDQINYQSDSYNWNAAANKAALESAIMYEEIVKKQSDIIDERFQLGAISRTDLLMISTRLKEADLQLIKARQNYKLALHKLNILIGISPDAPVDNLSPITLPFEPVQIFILEAVLDRRPE